jgi:uncharacterized ferritin-like protein (DUF455 family)
MIPYNHFFKQILLGEELSDKLIDLEISWDSFKEFSMPKYPGRGEKLKFSQVQLKFPKSQSLSEDNKKAQALHSFANHELLAIEMMAAAILFFPHHSEEDLKFKKGLFSALKDEQKHFQLYIKRLNEIGYQFGDFPVNDFFWRQMDKLTNPSQFVALMSLTLESANLDFANYYSKIFFNLGDKKTSEILEIVLKDEITHVAFGSYWMKKWREDKTLWEYYNQCLPWPISPARSKGINFSSELHLKSINDKDFVERLSLYQDDFSVTKRKVNAPNKD